MKLIRKDKRNLKAKLVISWQLRLINNSYLRMVYLCYRKIKDIIGSICKCLNLITFIYNSILFMLFIELNLN